MGDYERAIEPLASVPLPSPRRSGDIVQQAQSTPSPGHGLLVSWATIVGRSTASGRAWQTLKGDAAPRALFGLAASLRAIPLPGLPGASPNSASLPRAWPAAKKRLRIAEAVAHPVSLHACLMRARSAGPPSRATSPGPSPCSNGPSALLSGLQTSRLVSP